MTHDHVHYKSLLTSMAIVSVFEVVVAITIMIVVRLSCKHKKPSSTTSDDDDLCL